MNTPKGWHRHPNGGGLVQDSAEVSDSAYVGIHARVSGHAWVFGNARVSGNAQVSGDAWDESPPQMQIGRWYGHMRNAKTVAIGCQTCSVEEDLSAWLHDLAEKHDATDTELSSALVFVDLCKALKGGE